MNISYFSVRFMHKHYVQTGHHRSYPPYNNKRLPLSLIFHFFVQIFHALEVSEYSRIDLCMNICLKNKKITVVCTWIVPVYELMLALLEYDYI